MKTRKLLLSIIAVFLCAIFVAEPVSAVTIDGTVGEPSDLYLGEEQEDTVVGEGGENTKSEHEKWLDSQDAINKQLNRENTRTAESIIDSLMKNENGEKVPTEYYTKQDDSYVFVYEEFVARTLVDTIANTVHEYVPGRTDYFTISKWVPKSSPIPDNLVYDPSSILAGTIIEPEHGVLEDKTWTKFLIPLVTPDELKERHILTEKIREIYGGRWVRQTVENGYVKHEIPGIWTGIMDFDNMKDRYSALEYYLSTKGENEDIKVRYIVQYKTRSAVNASIRSSKVQKWLNTDQTHFWEIRYRDAVNGAIVPPLSTFSGETLEGVIPYYAGTYDVQNTQCLHRTFWDAMTYSKCEYLVIEETGQVIWKEESWGPAINVSKPMDEQSRWNWLYVGFRYEDNIHVTLTGEWIVKEDFLIGGYKAPSAWGEDYTSVRIE